MPGALKAKGRIYSLALQIGEAFSGEVFTLEMSADIHEELSQTEKGGKYVP